MAEQTKRATRIVFTGGGTAGHVTPNIALMMPLLSEGWDVHYIGSNNGMEKGLISGIEGVTYHGISTGKLRRYFSWQNFIDPFRVVKGYAQARKLIKKLKPDVIFSKGGFVSVPVVLGAGKVPVIAHESDYSPGLSNRIATRFTDKVCLSFEDSLAYVPKGKGIFTGTPIRPALYRGSREKALAFTGFSGEKPVLLVMGGSLGAQKLNELVRAALPLLCDRFDVIHLCGNGKNDCSCEACGYQQYEYINEELPDLLSLADIVLSRAGANSVFELLALNKPSVLVPLTSASSRGDQLLNARYFEKKGYAKVVDQNTATPESLVKEIDEVFDQRAEYARRMCEDTRSDGTQTILAIIKEAVTNG